jgi:cytidine deaminase
MTHDELIKKAASVINARKNGSYTLGDVGAALVTASGKVHVGVCIDARSSIGFCAEHAAIASMVTAGESKIATIVATWKDDKGLLYVLPPCGRCRELIFQMDEANLETEVILGRNEFVKLSTLLPRPEEFNQV